MTFTCDVEVHDPEGGVNFHLVADPESDALFGLSCTLTKDGKRFTAHVAALDLSDGYIRALMMLGQDFGAPCIGIFVPLADGQQPIIGRWQTAFEAAGLQKELAGLSQRQGMKLLERASQEGLYATQPAIGAYLHPSELLEAQPITLVRCQFTR